ncbi:2OG-Fe(II) oxygenase [Nostoc sp. UHCC 0302]|uniref:2OG-Fe(II) oxygenase n=1 Tax=Nostoc sp. UHCC 0302 TaxID=3134896 RepID=UPI00311C8FE5
MNKIITKVRNRILENLYRLPLLSKTSDLAYQAAIDQHIDHLPIISKNDLKLIEALQNQGIVITSLAALSIPSTPQMYQEAKILMPEISQIISVNKNEFIIHATSEQMMEHIEIFLWGLQQNLLNIIENYIGLPIAYHGSYYRRDIVNQVQRKSRLWHLDKEDRKVLKVIVYLNNVNEQNGPFQYIPKYFSSKIFNSLKYNYEYIQDKAMQTVISPLNWKSCIGASGTVIIADTANIFHRGKIPIDSDRFTIFFDYTSRRPKHPFYCQTSLSNDNLLKIATKISETQRQCIFWQKT